MDHRSLLSGRDQRTGTSVVRGALWIASGGYQVAAQLRRWQYDTGRRTIHRADVPVISVGNLTVGGTGKTPVVADLCRRLRQLSRRVAIISRGYAATDAGFNDEAMELSQRLPDVPHVQHVDRVEAARIAVDELDAEVIVMDDGFQHRRLHRDLDVLVIDATCPFGYGYCLPRGYLREPISSLARADLILLTRTNQVPAPEISNIDAIIRRWRPAIPILSTCHEPVALGQLDGSSRDLSALRGRPVGIVSGIGNPAAFAQTITSCGANVVERVDLPDHDGYDRATRERLRETFSNSSPQPDWIICTQKDFVKLATDRIAGVPLAFLQIDLAYRSSLEPLDTRLAECLAGR